jgi:hypothetical protein
MIPDKSQETTEDPEGVLHLPEQLAPARTEEDPEHRGKAPAAAVELVPEL